MTKSFLATVSVGALLLVMAQFGTTAEEYEAGIDFHVLLAEEEAESPVEPADNAGMISVVEYFSYGCSACMKFEEHISNWLPTIDDDVEFRREAVIFFANWAPLAKAYYVAIELDVLDAVHIPMFEAQHDKKLPMDDPLQIEQLFVAEAEIERETFRTTYNDDDESVMDRVLEVHEKVRIMRIKRTPTIVVDDRYMVNTRTAQSRKRIFPIVDFLVEKVREEKKSTLQNGSPTE